MEPMMALEQAAGEVLIGGFDGFEAPARLIDRLAQGRLGGVILFARNIKDEAQLLRLTASLRQTKPDHLPWIGVDQEGGRVQRVKAKHGSVDIPSMRQVAALGDAKLSHELGVLLGQELAALGFNLNFAPVLDIDTNPDNPIIGDRSFGRSAEEVIVHGGAFARGLLEAGVWPCGKHLPGHGDTSIDSHLGLPTMAHTWERLQEVELRPFVALAELLPMMMTAHIHFPVLDPDLPVTLSRRAIEVLRAELSFHDILVSDDLEMGAIADTWGISSAAVKAIEAGLDLLLVCGASQSWREAYEGLLSAAQAHPPFADRLRRAATRAAKARAVLHRHHEDAVSQKGRRARLQALLARARR